MTKPLRILLIDDEALVREELGGLLVEEGYDLVTAADGEEGVTRFRRDRPDLVITDVRMPRRDGLSVAAAIRSENWHVPIAVITGHGTEQMVIEALRAGVVDFIKKPVRYEDLCAALERMKAARTLAQHPLVELPASVQCLERTWRYRLANELSAVPIFVDDLLRQCAPSAEPRLVSELCLALRELIINAIEHGNLEIDYEQKRQATEQGTFAEVLAQRTSLLAMQQRDVAVTVRLADDELTVRIRDGGDGFDWRSLPDPTDPANLLLAHGRGVLLARISVDGLTYNETGNEVTVVKALTIPAPARSDDGHPS